MTNPNVVSISNHKTHTCPSCGAKVMRQKTITRPVDPLSLDNEGFLRTHERVTKTICDDLRAWADTPELCTTCRRKAINDRS